ncbi:MAG: PadR family transcriptional regulator [Acidimicrobiia bacterium]|nr:PadR family transcriptional regulator [Acidimicrobiia bacterium]
MEPTPLSLTEYAVLGLLAEGPAHGFGLSKGLEAGSPVGRVVTVRRPLVYRALGRLVSAGLAAPERVEAGEAGPQRVIHRITPQGRRRLQQWLEEPVGHVRDLRLGFLVKLVLVQRAGGSPGPLIVRQRTVLHDALQALAQAAGSTEDVVELWRAHNAMAARSFLDHLGERYPEPR